MSMNRTYSQPRRMAGVSLIEVMISVLILGIGMLGIAAMQTTALRNNQSAMQRSQAVMETYTILDAMRANRDVALSGGYDTGGMMCSAPTGSGRVVSDQAMWITGLKQAMADVDTTCGSIACNGGSCTITVQWDDSRGTSVDSTIDATAMNIQTVTQL